MNAVKQVTSFSNPEIKRIKGLALRKQREENGTFLSEGLRHALEADAAGWEFETLVVTEGTREKKLAADLLERCLARGVACLEVPANVMESIVKRDNAQSVIAVLRQQWLPLSRVTGGVWIALEEIRDPGNLGTIMRTADAVGAHGVILIGNSCDPYSREAIRASMGSFPHVALVRVPREEFIAWAEGSGFQIVGTHLKASHDYRTLPYRPNLVLLMGNEQAGLTDAMSDVCTERVIIPMRGHADSLNVAVATAVMLFEVNRAGLMISA